MVNESIIDTYKRLIDNYEQTNDQDVLDLLESLEIANSSLSSKNLGVPCDWLLNWQNESILLLDNLINLRKER